MSLKPLIIFILCILAFSGTSSAWLSGYSYEKDVTINTTVASTLTDFPAKITVDTATLISAGKMQAGCNDTRFTDTSDVALSYELETLTCNSTTTIFWVKVPSATTTTTIRMYYANSTAISGTTPSAVWSNGYQNVWHMTELNVIDSLGTNNGTAYNMEGGDVANSNWGKGITFDGTNEYIDLGVVNALNTGTVSIKLGANKGTNKIAYYLDRGPNSDVYGYFGIIYDASNFALCNSSGSSSFQSYANVDPNTLYSFAFVSPNIFPYENATVGNAMVRGGLNAGASSKTSIARAGEYANYYFDGTIDEIRISTINRSAAWVGAEALQTATLGTEAGTPVLTTPTLANASETENKTMTVIITSPLPMTAYTILVTYNNTQMLNSTATGLTNSTFTFLIPIVSPLVSTNNTNISWVVTANITQANVVYNLTSAGNQSVAQWFFPVTLQTPANASTVYGVDLPITYYINTSDFMGINIPLLCNLSVDGAVKYSATYSTPANVSYLSNQTNGEHNYNVTCSLTGTSFIRSSSTYSFTAIPPFVAVHITPAINSFIYSYSNTFSYNVTTNITYPLTAVLYIDGNVYATNTISTNSTISHYITLSSGTHSWYVNVTGGGMYYNSSLSSFTISSIDQQFNDYLNVSMSTCSASVQANLTLCNEFYKLNRIYNYSAIVCPIEAQNLTCLGATINNYTKNNYTVIYSPSSWVYAGGLANITGLEHTGAIFYTGGAAIQPGIELINSTHFVYLPVQTKDRDCTIKYLSTDTTTNCSYANGFVINNRQVIVSDRQGYFYTAGGLAVVSYTSNYSNMVIPVSLLPLQFYYVTHGETGIFTKMSCNNQNGTYTVDLINTVSKAFSVTVTGTGAATYTGSGQSYYKQLTLGNDTNVSVSADGYLVCSYTSDSFTFMNINLSFLNTGLLSWLYKMLGLFLIVISTISPYFLFAFILFNDMFRSFTVYQVGMLTGFTIMLSLISNYQSMERGLKHVAMLFFIFAGFLVVFAPYWSNAGTVNFAAITAFQSSFSNWQNANNMGDMTWNALNVIIQFFLLVLNLPALIVDFIFALMNVVMPAVTQGFNGLRQPIELAFTVFIYVKAYEIITNKFRGV